MSAPVVELVDRRLVANPGERVSTTLRVRSVKPLAAAGAREDVVDQCRFRIPPHCPAGAWVTFRTTEAGRSAEGPVASVGNIRPGEEVTIDVSFTVPDTPEVPSGDSHYVIAVETPEGRLLTSVEGTVAVVARPGFASALDTPSVKGRWTVTAGLRVTNTGNHPLTLTLASQHDVGELAVVWDPPQLALPHRGKGEFRIGLKPRTPNVVGKPVKHELPLTVSTVPAGPSQLTDRQRLAYEQRAWLPTWAIPVAVVAVVAAAALLVFRGGLTSNEAPPDPPTALEAVVGVDTAQLSWLPDKKATTTVVALVDCAAGGAVDPVILDSAPFEGKARGDLPLAGASGPGYCFRARSGGAGGEGVWGEMIGPVLGADPTVPVPQGLTTENDSLVWQATAGDQYELIVDNRKAASDIFNSPLPLLALNLLPGPHELQLRTIRAGAASDPSVPVTWIQPEPPPSGPETSTPDTTGGAPVTPALGGGNGGGVGGGDGGSTDPSLTDPTTPDTGVGGSDPDPITETPPVSGSSSGPSSGPAVSSGGSLIVAAIGDDGRVYAQVRAEGQTATWVPTWLPLMPPPNATPAVELTGSPALVRAGGRLFVNAISSDGRLHTTHAKEGEGSWSYTEDDKSAPAGVTLVGSPAAAPGDDALLVLAAGADGKLYLRVRTLSTGKWESSWKSLGGPTGAKLNGPPALAATDEGLLVVMGTDSGNVFSLLVANDGSSAGKWEGRDRPSAGLIGPVRAAVSNGMVVVAVTGEDGKLYYRTREEKAGAAWSKGWERLSPPGGVALTTGPALVRADGQLFLLAFGNDGRLYEATRNASSGTWSDGFTARPAPPTAPKGPPAAAASDSKVFVLFPAPDGLLYLTRADVSDKWGATWETRAAPSGRKLGPYR